MKTISIGDDKVKQVLIGDAKGLVLMAGPCVIESKDLCFRIAEYLKPLTDKMDFPERLPLSQNKDMEFWITRLAYYAELTKQVEERIIPLCISS